MRSASPRKYRVVVTFFSQFFICKIWVGNFVQRSVVLLLELVDSVDCIFININKLDCGILFVRVKGCFGSLKWILESRARQSLPASFGLVRRSMALTEATQMAWLGWCKNTLPEPGIAAQPCCSMMVVSVASQSAPASGYP